MQAGIHVMVIKNIQGNECEPFVGMTGVIIRKKKNNWFTVSLDEQTTYGRIFHFHQDELEEMYA